MSPHIMPTYNRLPIRFTHGQGAWLWDEKGTRYLDALSGIAVCNLGHTHPAVHKAICEQSERLIHTSNLYNIAAQEQLAKALCEKSAMDNVFFSNSGAEANETALKIARAYGHQQGIDQPIVITMEKSFHGRTMATLSATGNPKVKQGFSPLLEGFIHVPFNDIPALKKAISETKNCVAIFVEPIQGEGGVHIPEKDYLSQVRKLCDENQLLMMLDEIQTGIGRTGKFLAYQHSNILPDICTLAKALANGVPIGACLARGRAASVLTAGMHGSTFGGNPLACSAALAVLETLEAENLIVTAEIKGQKITQLLHVKLKNNANVNHIRHQGLMIGLDLNRPCLDLALKAQQSGLLINIINEKTIRLLPPLIINDEQIKLLTDQLASLIDTYTS